MSLTDGQSVVEFYRNTFQKHGASAEGMAYRDEESHMRRLNLARRLADYWEFWEEGDYEDRSVLDVGCGIGEVLRLWPISKDTRYVGIDVVPEYVHTAKDRIDNFHIHNANLGFPAVRSEWDVFCEDFFTFLPNLVPMDITLALGTFAWQPGEVATRMLDEMWTLTKDVMIFTALVDRPFSRQALMYMEQRLRDVKSSSYNYFPHGFYGGKAGVPEVMVALYKERDDDDVEPTTEDPADVDSSNGANDALG